MRDKLIWKFLGAYVPLILVAVIVLNFFVSFNLKNHFEQKITDRLHGNSLLASTILKDSIEIKNIPLIREQVKTLGEQLDLRVTVVDAQGNVLGDSQKNPDDMENHGNRPEIMDALLNGKGESLRFSNTLNYSMKYVALPIQNLGKPSGVVRLSMAMKDVDEQIRVIYQAVLWGGVVAAFLMIVVGYFISRSITNPISEMRYIAQKISSGDFSQKIQVKSKDELGSLAESLNKMADELQSQIESLKRMDRVRTDFVANVSHELKTPLTSIKGYVETLQDGAINDPENAHKFLNIIKKHTDSLTYIVNDLLTLSEAELKADRLEVVEFDMKEFLSGIIQAYERIAQKKELQLDFHVMNDHIRIKADRGKLEQVFVNLIDNATKYTDTGGRIDVTLNRDKNCCSVTVQDNGIGIPASDVQRVFERFYRVDKARSNALGGTGLGLAIVKHIVSLHNGDATLESESGKGTKVTVTLPCNVSSHHTDPIFT